jgi:hypothetical protein
MHLHQSHKIKFIILSLLVLTTYSIRAQMPDQERLISDLRYKCYCLADDSMGGRLAGSNNEYKAARNIAEWFKKLHLKPYGGKNFLHAFTFPDDSGNFLKSHNIIGACGNKKGPVIIIGAHYDHIGNGGKLSRSLLSNEVHNGADDNASGVAVVTELARSMSKCRGLKNSYVFIAFAAHETGLHGSRQLVRNNLIDTKRIALMINFDMIGRFDSISRKLFYSSNRPRYDSLLTHAQHDGIKLARKDLPQGDHSSFDSVNIPVMYFTTGMHDDYHKTTDDAGALNYRGMATLTEFIFAVLKEIESRDVIAKEPN